MGSWIRNCGIITIIGGGICYFLMSLILIGMSVKVCEKVILSKKTLSSSVLWNIWSNFEIVGKLLLKRKPE